MHVTHFGISSSSGSHSQARSNIQLRDLRMYRFGKESSYLHASLSSLQVSVIRLIQNCWQSCNFVCRACIMSIVTGLYLICDQFL